MLEKQPAVYILTHEPNGVLYTGVTSALWNRISTHKDGNIPGFAKTYHAKLLVWYEHHHTMEAAIRREKQIKEWKRDWKIQMIEKFNPQWQDLHDKIDPIGTLVAYEPEADSGFSPRRS